MTKKFKLLIVMVLLGIVCDSEASNQCHHAFESNSIEALRVHQSTLIELQGELGGKLVVSGGEILSASEISALDAKSLSAQGVRELGSSLGLNASHVEFKYWKYEFIDSGSWTHSGASETRYYLVLRDVRTGNGLSVSQVDSEATTRIFLSQARPEILFVEVQDIERRPVYLDLGGGPTYWERTPRTRYFIIESI